MSGQRGGALGVLSLLFSGTAVLSLLPSIPLKGFPVAITAVAGVALGLLAMRRPNRSLSVIGLVLGVSYMAFMVSMVIGSWLLGVYPQTVAWRMNACLRCLCDTSNHPCGLVVAIGCSPYSAGTEPGLPAGANVPFTVQ